MTLAGLLYWATIIIGGAIGGAIMAVVWHAGKWLIKKVTKRRSYRATILRDKPMRFYTFDEKEQS